MYLHKKARRLFITGAACAMAATFSFPAAAAGFTTVGEKTYYYLESGQPYTGLLHLNDTYYYFLQDGSMVVGWLKLDGNYYYMGKDGSLSTGWVQIGNDWYYMRPESGICVLDEAIEIDNAWYYFKNDGKRLTGWLKKDNQYYYLDPAANGRLVANTTKVIDGVSYNFAPNGVCTTNMEVSNAYTPKTSSSENASNSTPESTAQNSGNTQDSQRSRVVTAGSHND